MPFTISAFAVGLISIVASFPIAKAFHRPPTAANYETVAPLLLKQFFVGFALSEAGAICGLLVFFVYADINPLLLLTVLTALAIYLHCLRVKRAIEDIEQRSG